MIDENEIDGLLQYGLVHVPEDFRTRVMQQVAEHEQERLSVTSPQVKPMAWWQWSAVIAGSVLGIGQVLRFIFAIWLVTAAG